MVRDVLRTCGWASESYDWVWPIVAGHHGRVPGVIEVDPVSRLEWRRGHGWRAWAPLQRALVERLADELRVELAVAEPRRPPSRAVQLAVSGLVVMADWIASSSYFVGVDDPSLVGMELARERAAVAWRRLRIRGGWRTLPDLAGKDCVGLRFGKPARAVQRTAVMLAERVPAPSLLVVEAPTGAGKTELSLAVAEVLARRFGQDGVCVGMPTQATCNPMFSRVRRWSRRVDPEVPVSLLHGKARFNKEWADLLRGVEFHGIDDDIPGDGQAPAEWCLGRHRGLLTPVAVATVDQILHAMTRTGHVMLRHAGLAGRVVVLDEVHAYDVYTSEFLFEALRWFGDAGTPVVLLSATLPPDRREALMRAYLQGALKRRNVEMKMVDRALYPALTAVAVVDGHVWREQQTAPMDPRPGHVRVEIVDEGPGEPPGYVAALIRERLADGGCALVVRNSVARAQHTYLALKRFFGASEVTLLHARFDDATRAERTEEVLARLGASDAERPATRPHRFVVVATQVAEQSFDIDADLVITDLAPIDLLLQRVGRLHRHDRDETARPERVRTPCLVVTGMRRDGPMVPALLDESVAIYGEAILLRAAALVLAATADGWRLPDDIPGLVRQGYPDSDPVPASWARRLAQADEAWRRDCESRRARAQPFVLSGERRLGETTLAGLHGRTVADLPDEDAAAAVVRDGRPSVEVIMVRRDEDGYLTLTGRRLGPDGAPVTEDDLEGLVQATVRLPSHPRLAAEASRLRPLPGWSADPWLGRARALVLDGDGHAIGVAHQLRYSVELGLVELRHAFLGGVVDPCEAGTDVPQS